MLRVYAIELDEGCFVITGGAIKLTPQMTTNELINEKNRIEQVQEYLKLSGISDKAGLI